MIGQIRNSTQPFLIQYLKTIGTDLVDCQMIGDEPEDFFRFISRVQKKNVDIIITTGAVSMGKHDFIKSALLELGGKVIFHKLAMRPGKPLMFGELSSQGPVLFGLPGNPISTLVGVRFFVDPYVRRMLGMQDEKSFMGQLDTPYSKNSKFRHLLKSYSKVDSKGVVKTRILNGQESFKIKSIIESNSLALIGEDQLELEVGDRVQLVPLFPNQAEEIPWKS